MSNLIVKNLDLQQLYSHLFTLEKNDEKIEYIITINADYEETKLLINAHIIKSAKNFIENKEIGDVFKFIKDKGYFIKVEYATETDKYSGKIKQFQDILNKD